MVSKKALEMSFAGYLIIAVVVLAIVLLGIALAQGKGSAGLAFVRNFFSFGAG